MLSDSPPERDLEWTDAGVDGAWRYLNRLWRLVDERAREPAGAGGRGRRARARRRSAASGCSTGRSQQVTAELERLHFNKAVALVRELSNALEAFAPAGRGRPGAACARRWRPSSLLLGPMAPHLAEELWQRLGHQRPARRRRPGPRPIRPGPMADTVVVAVQVNGKRRAEIVLPRGSSREEAEARALADAAVLRAHGGQAAAAGGRRAGQDRQRGGLSAMRRAARPMRPPACCCLGRAAACGRSTARPRARELLPQLAAIEVSEQYGRRGQYFRNYLLDELNPDGLQVPPAYDLAVVAAPGGQRAGDPARRLGHPLQPDPRRQLHPDPAQPTASRSTARRRGGW